VMLLMHPQMHRAGNLPAEDNRPQASV